MNATPRRTVKALVKIAVTFTLLLIAIIAVAASIEGNGTTSSRHSLPVPTALAPTASYVSPNVVSSAAPQFNPEQQQVLESAESYLSSGQGFSKAGLMKQLTSSYGEGFSHRLAAFAIAQLRPNWNQQAVISANGYLSSGQGFSYNGLVQQLESPYGEQFTPAQSRHGASIALRP